MTQTQHSAEGHNCERGLLAELSHEVDGVRYIGAAGRLLDDAIKASCDAELFLLVSDVEQLLPYCSPGALVGLRRKLYQLVGPIADPNGPDGLAGLDGPPPGPQVVQWPQQVITSPDQVPDPPHVLPDPDTESGDPTEALDAAMTGSRRRARRASGEQAG